MSLVEAGTRRVAFVVDSHPAQPAPGLVVRRPLPGPEVELVGPFIMIDHFGPTTIRPGGEGGLNPHPHRGFETVTILLEGAMEHQDSLGNRGILRPGDVQWMTAARGIVHAEYHEAAFARDGGTLQGMQLWVNLPARHKMAEPGHQLLASGAIPVVPFSAGAVRVIAGEALGARGAARTFTPMSVLHVRFDSAGSVELPVPGGFHGLVYAIRNGVSVDGSALAEAQMAVLQLQASDGAIALRAVGPAEALVLAGAPIDEPVASWGPFVMNTREEIMQARRDFATGVMGRLGGVPF